MRSTRTTHILLAIVAILLAANLLRPLLQPRSAHAQEDASVQTEMAAGAGAVWILRENVLYYATYEQDFDAIKIHRPEKLDR